MKIDSGWETPGRRSFKIEGGAARVAKIKELNVTTRFSWQAGALKFEMGHRTGGSTVVEINYCARGTCTKHDVLRRPRIVCDPIAIKSDCGCVGSANCIGARARVENHPRERYARGKREAGCIRNIKCGDVGAVIGDCGRRPVHRGVPITASRAEVPGGTASKRMGFDQAREQTDDGEKPFHPAMAAEKAADLKPIRTCPSQWRTLKMAVLE